jgi:hypothetical protein
MSHLKIVPILGLLFSIVAASYGQADKPLFCKQEVFAELKPIPKFEYRCDPDRTDDESEEILKMPARIYAIRAYIKNLERFNDSDWWAASVDDLNLCYFRGRAGALDDQEREKFSDGDWRIELFGNRRVRLILAPDPCYSTYYNGANAFLLYREAGIVHATEVVDGYYSRADNGLGMDIATSKSQEIIEINTGSGGSGLPDLTNYYFVIDPRSKRAVPKKLFKVGRKLTNQMTSAMLREYQPRRHELQVIQSHRLAKSFDVYHYVDTVDNQSGRIEDSGWKLSRVVYRWNGRFYTPIR